MLTALAAALLLAAPAPRPSTLAPRERTAPALDAAARRCAAALVTRHGEPERARAERGARQAAAAWRTSIGSGSGDGDGDAAAFEALCLAQFRPQGPELDATFARLEAALEALDGHQVEIGRELSRWAQLDVGPSQPIDALLAAHDPAAHLTDDLFAGKVAFAALLNFPLTSLQERLTAGRAWTRRQWAEARLAQRFARRVPAAASQAFTAALSAADLYIADYNLFLHHALSADGERLFPSGKRLLSHWNLRDELKALYGQPGALERQRLIARAMERIVDQTIPAAVVNDPRVDWSPFTGEVRPAPAGTIETGAPPLPRAAAAREPDTRYARWLAVFHAARAADPYSPTAPTHIARMFDEGRELPVERVEALLTQILEAPEVRVAAARIRARLGRPLEPFDIWYSGFRPPADRPEPELDALTRARWPTAGAFARDLPEILERLGFTAERAAWLSARIEVDPARGSGHALGAARRGDHAHLRTRVGPAGMDYKGFNIAVHELGHNVEETFSLEGVDSTLLRGVPGTGFTEAIAFVFQARDLRVLGLPPPSEAQRQLRALDDLWAAFEIAGVALVDLEVWRWMYAHPRATPAALRAATLDLARSVWNRWYAPVLGVRDSTLLAIYSHLVSNALYLPDYPLGHLIQAQLEAHFEAIPPGALGAELERVILAGNIAPDLWMENATGAPLSAEALLAAARRALGAPDGAPAP